MAADSVISMTMSAGHSPCSAIVASSAGQHALLGELRTGEVDIDPHRRAQRVGVAPDPDLPAHLRDESAADGQKQAIGLDERHEDPGRQDAAVRLTPANQRLEPGQAAGLEIDERLEVRQELVALEAEPQAPSRAAGARPPSRACRRRTSRCGPLPRVLAQPIAVSASRSRSSGVVAGSPPPSVMPMLAVVKISRPSIRNGRASPRCTRSATRSRVERRRARAAAGSRTRRRRDEPPCARRARPGLGRATPSVARSEPSSRRATACSSWSPQVLAVAFVHQFEVVQVEHQHGASARPLLDVLGEDAFEPIVEQHAVGQAGEPIDDLAVGDVRLRTGHAHRRARRRRARPRHGPAPSGTSPTCDGSGARSRSAGRGRTGGRRDRGAAAAGPRRARARTTRRARRRSQRPRSRQSPSSDPSSAGAAPGRSQSHRPSLAPLAASA